MLAEEKLREEWRFYMTLSIAIRKIHQLFVLTLLLLGIIVAPVMAGETNGLRGTATPITPNQDMPATINVSTLADWYSFTAPTDIESITELGIFHQRNIDGEVTINLFDGEPYTGYYTFTKTLYTSRNVITMDLSKYVQPGKKYYLKIEGVKGDPYVLHLSMPPYGTDNGYRGSAILAANGKSINGKIANTLKNWYIFSTSQGSSSVVEAVLSHNTGAGDLNLVLYAGDNFSAVELCNKTLYASRQSLTVDLSSLVSPGKKYYVTVAGTLSDPYSLLFNGIVSDANTKVQIKDQNLEKSIRDELNKSTGDITPTDMASLTELYTAKLTDLQGLELATHLKVLYITDSSLSDLSPLMDLTGLTELTLKNCNINNIAKLSNLTNLHSLILQDNLISDISALSALTNLTEINLKLNAISNISVLARFGNLTSLNLGNNKITEISVLAGLLNLKSVLLDNNTISDISALQANSGLSSGDTINLDKNYIDFSSGSKAAGVLKQLNSAGVTVSALAQTVTTPDSSNAPEVIEKTDVKADKSEWTIKFSMLVDPSTVTGQAIYLTDAQGAPVTASYLTAENDLVKVGSPTGGYTPGQTYYLNIGNSIKSKLNPATNSSKLLKNPVKMKFTIANPAPVINTKLWWVENETKLVSQNQTIYQDQDGIVAPLISPDNKWVVYQHLGVDLLLVNIPTGHKQTLYSLPQNLWADFRLYPQGWSANSQEILFLTSYRGVPVGSNELKLADLNGNTSLVMKGVSSADWAGDGKIVVSTPKEIKIIDRPGNTIQLLNMPSGSLLSYPDNPSWSPDGNKLVFNMSGGYYLYNLSSNTYKLLFEKDSAGNARINAASQVVYAAKGAIYIYDPATNQNQVYYQEIGKNCGFPGWGN